MFDVRTSLRSIARLAGVAAIVALSLLLMTACMGKSPSLFGGANEAEYVVAEPGHYHYHDHDYEEEEAPGYPVDQHREWAENRFISAEEEATSTFSIDVNSASYTMMRRDLNNGALPDIAGVRVEEYLNYFRYNYPQPVDGQPFSINMEAAPSYFGAGEEQKHLLRIGIRGKDVAVGDMKHNNLIFLVDVSGSMGPENRLPLAKQGMLMMLEHLRPTDTVGIHVYASDNRTILEPTPVSNRVAIERAIRSLKTGGSTRGDAAIVKAYDMAERARVEGGNNRVIILTDSDFNVGRTGDALVQLVRERRDKQIGLTCMGFGLGGYNDATMEALARKGNGNYFYIDTREEAERIFSTHISSTLEAIASDVRLQVEFDPKTVSKYRLVGYERRVMKNEDFRDVEQDAGEIGPGHTVTAIYEMELVPGVDDAHANLATVRVRYKEQFGDEPLEFENVIKRAHVLENFEQASASYRFAAAVTEFAQIMRDSEHSKGLRLGEVYQVAKAAASAKSVEEAEFLTLVKKAQAMLE